MRTSFTNPPSASSSGLTSSNSIQNTKFYLNSKKIYTLVLFAFAIIAISNIPAVAATAGGNGCSETCQKLGEGKLVAVCSNACTFLGQDVIKVVSNCQSYCLLSYFVGGDVHSVCLSGCLGLHGVYSAGKGVFSIGQALIPRLF